jgi:beta-glucanase (GH16 family)
MGRPLPPPAASRPRGLIAVALAVLLSGASTPDEIVSGRVLVNGETAVLAHMGQRAELRLTFADEFDGFSRFDGTKGLWRTTYGFKGPESFGGRTMSWHDEEQLYVDASDKGSGRQPLGIQPFVIRDGMLEITADRTTPAQAKALWKYRYTSGLITTQGAFSQTYGYFEMRARLPAGQGFWPAFWLCADDSWPPEIDIFEVLGHDPRTVFMTTHILENDERRAIGKTYTGVDTSDGFHIYGMAWSPKTIRYYVDRQEVAAIPTPGSVNAPMYLLANLGVGGAWPGRPDDTTPFPAKMIIDYIRVYQFLDQPRPYERVIRPSDFATGPAAPESASQNEPSPQDGE